MTDDQADALAALELELGDLVRRVAVLTRKMADAHGSASVASGLVAPDAAFRRWPSRERIELERQTDGQWWARGYNFVALGPTPNRAVAELVRMLTDAESRRAP